MHIVSATAKDLFDDAWRYHTGKNSILSEHSFHLSSDLSLDLLQLKK